MVERARSRCSYLEIPRRRRRRRSLAEIEVILENELALAIRSTTYLQISAIAGS